MTPQAFVPLVTYPDANSDALAANAVAAARWIGADLNVLVLNADIPQISNAFSRLLIDVPDMIRGAEELSRKRSALLLEAIGNQARAVGLQVRSEKAAAGIARLGDAAATRARYCDISLIGWEAGNPTSRMTAETVLFGSGRPAILLPELSGVAPLDHLAIAWDGSRVAARAVADAQPFLGRASRITVLTILDEKPLKERDAGERLVDALRRQGLAAEAASVNAEDCPIAETLQQAAIERGSNLLVMGAYGHSRVRDFVLGGATAGILSDLQLPVLLSH
ncbi:MAG: universal stress protein [Rhizobiaceae bacterium]|jgi:nucleotide-binding universal stress UspA family protein|nr:universal stress protein [Rhizobiaceae bacterium]